MQGQGAAGPAVLRRVLGRARATCEAASGRAGRVASCGSGRVGSGSGRAGSTRPGRSSGGGPRAGLRRRPGSAAARRRAAPDSSGSVAASGVGRPAGAPSTELSGRPRPGQARAGLRSRGAHPAGGLEDLEGGVVRPFRRLDGPGRHRQSRRRCRPRIDALRGRGRTGRRARGGPLAITIPDRGRPCRQADLARSRGVPSRSLRPSASACRPVSSRVRAWRPGLRRPGPRGT